MTENDGAPFRGSDLLKIAGGATVLLGGAALVGRWAEAGVLVQPIERGESVSPLTAVALVLLGGGAVALAFQRLRWLRIAAFGVFLTVAASGLQALLVDNLGMDATIREGSTAKDAWRPQGMSGDTASALCAGAVALVLLGRQPCSRARHLAGATLSAIVVSASSLTLVGYALGADAAPGGWTLGRLPPILAFALLLLGVALLVGTCRSTGPDRGGPPAWLPIPVGAGALTATLCIWRSLVELTGHGQSSHERRAREAGFDRHLVKPVDLGVLRSILAGGLAPGTLPARQD